MSAGCRARKRAAQAWRKAALRVEGGEQAHVAAQGALEIGADALGEGDREPRGGVDPDQLVAL